MAAAAGRAACYVIILTFGPVSGGHFNPVVSLADAVFGGPSWQDATAYLPAQVGGCARTGPAAVGAYIGAAYFFTSSASFANPAGQPG